MGSSRLPGKTLKELLGKPMLYYVIERLKRVNLAQHLLIATTDKAEDQPIVDFANALNISTFRGSSEDVLQRYAKSAKQLDADIVVRITADCPLIDPAVVNRAIAEFLLRDADFVSNTIERTYPRGMDVEVFSMRTLEEIDRSATLPEDREHVTSYLLRHSSSFRIEQFLHDVDASRYRLSVDTKEDFELVEKIMKALYPENHIFGVDAIVSFLDSHPDIAKLNSHIKQKRIGHGGS